MAIIEGYSRMFCGGNQTISLNNIIILPKETPYSVDRGRIVFDGEASAMYEWQKTVREIKPVKAEGLLRSTLSFVKSDLLRPRHSRRDSYESQSRSIFSRASELLSTRSFLRR